jgi:hypothetical protein
MLWRQNAVTVEAHATLQNAPVDAFSPRCPNGLYGNGNAPCEHALPTFAWLLHGCGESERSVIGANEIMRSF